jgi:hypothetical protein
MTDSPDEHQPEPPVLRQPAQDQPRGAAGSSGLPREGTRAPADGVPDAAGLGYLADDEPADELTAEQVAELTRRDWVDPDPDDPAYWDDPDCSPPEWLALPPEEQARQLAEAEAKAQPRAAGVREAIDAGFTHRDGGNGTGFEAGGPVDRMLPGTDLAWHVGQARQRGLPVLSDDELIGFLEAVHELGSWASALELDAVSELDARRAQPDGSEGEHVDAEVGASLTLTPRSAQILLDRARGLQRLAPVLTLLANGIIDARKADVILRRVCLLSDEHAAQVLDRVLPKAQLLTTGELAARLDRAIIAVDPTAARRRREKAQKDARVEAWTEDSGTGALAGRDLPPAEVIAADKNLDADAQWLKQHGVEGSHNELRAMAFTARVNGRALASLLPPAPATAGTPATAATDSAPGTDSAGTAADGGSSPNGPDGADTRNVPGHPGTAMGSWPALAGSVNLTMPAATFLGRSDNPGEVTGYGPVDAGTCQDLASRLAAAGRATQWCLTLVNDSGQAVGHGCARAGPPLPDARSPGSRPPGTGPPGTGPPGSRPPGAGPPGSSPPGSVSDQLAWLASITITPIATGTCSHERESPGYRPPESLRHLIKIRSPRCGEPGCRTPARQADDDHTIPYHLGGKTCECNLHPLCRRSHRTKQTPGWHVTQPEPGILIWQAPSGRCYTKINEPYPV